VLEPTHEPASVVAKNRFVNQLAFFLEAEMLWLNIMFEERYDIYAESSFIGLFREESLIYYTAVFPGSYWK
jgi:hypothetical protein